MKNTFKMKLKLLALLALCLCLPLAGADEATGIKKWEFKTQEGVSSSPAIGADGAVYIGTQESWFYALDSKTGKVEWRKDLSGAITSSPAIGSDGTVYVGSLGKKVYAIATSSKGLAKSPWPMRGQNSQRTGRVMKK